jgi:hypothetical protein
MRRRASADLVARIDEINPPCRHPWRGATVSTVLPMDLHRLAVRLASLRSMLAEIETVSSQLRHNLDLQCAASLAGTKVLAQLGRAVAAAPHATPSYSPLAGGSSPWRREPNSCRRGLRFVTGIVGWCAFRSRHGDRFHRDPAAANDAWDALVALVQGRLAASRYDVADTSYVPPPKRTVDRVAILDGLPSRESSHRSGNYCKRAAPAIQAIKPVFMMSPFARRAVPRTRRNQLRYASDRQLTRSPFQEPASVMYCNWRYRPA